MESSDILGSVYSALLLQGSYVAGGCLKAHFASPAAGSELQSCPRLSPADSACLAEAFAEHSNVRSQGPATA